MLNTPASLSFLVAALVLAPSLQSPAQAVPQSPAAVQSPAGAPGVAQPPAPSEIPGVRNFTRVDASFACGGAFTPSAAASVKQAGFRSVVNLRAAGEEGADLDAEKAAVEAEGLTYIWLPFLPASPDASKLDAFVEAFRNPANQPMLLHCKSGGRASMFWAVKRVMVDGWPVEKAMNELSLAKHVSQPLRDFVLDYLKQHGK
jgi:uncharacterized protein (TIGR01244 family)